MCCRIVKPRRFLFVVSLSPGVGYDGSSTESPDPMPPRRRIRKSVCQTVRGTWKGRRTTDEIMKLTRGD